MKQKQRSKSIRAGLRQFVAQRGSNTVYNNSLRREILINSLDTGRETPFRGSLNELSYAMVTTSLLEILRYARKTGEYPPKGNANQRRFSSIVTLEREVKGLGTAKLTVGIRRSDGRPVQYCITAVRA